MAAKKKKCNHKNLGFQAWAQSLVIRALWKVNRVGVILNFEGKEGTMAEKVHLLVLVSWHFLIDKTQHMMEQVPIHYPLNLVEPAVVCYKALFYLAPLALFPILVFWLIKLAASTNPPLRENKLNKLLKHRGRLHASFLGFANYFSPNWLFFFKGYLP